MNEETKPKESASALDRATRLAYERTFLGWERTQMGWVRTALSLISFGFAIAKFFDFLRQKQVTPAPLLGPRTVGILMIGSGLVALAMASVQHRRALKVMREQCPGLPRSLAGVTGAFIALIGILALIGALLR
jgi:putative membrane protein